jgi:hypothetical protein
MQPFWLRAQRAVSYPRSSNRTCGFPASGSFDIGVPETLAAKDVPNTEGHVLDAGHFALDTNAGETSVPLGSS